MGEKNKRKHGKKECDDRKKAKKRNEQGWLMALS